MMIAALAVQERRIRMGKFKRQLIAKGEPMNPMTLADLDADKQYVMCWCNRCGHSADIDPTPLINRLGPLFPVPELGGRMRCTSCKSHDVTTCPAWLYDAEQIALHG